MDEKLPKDERIRILRGRLKNLEKGSGDFDPGNRVKVIERTRRHLAEAREDD